MIIRFLTSALPVILLQTATNAFFSSPSLTERFRIVLSQNSPL